MINNNKNKNPNKTITKDHASNHPATRVIYPRVSDYFTWVVLYFDIHICTTSDGTAKCVERPFVLESIDSYGRLGGRFELIGYEPWPIETNDLKCYTCHMGRPNSATCSFTYRIPRMWNLSFNQGCQSPFLCIHVWVVRVAL